MKNKNPKIKAVFFDLGGVVIMGPHKQLRDVLNIALKIPKKKLEEHFSLEIERLLSGKQTSTQFMRKICRYFGIPQLSREGIRYIFSEWYKHASTVNVPVFKLAKQLGRTYTVGIISDTVEEHVRVNKKKGIFKHFKPVILSNRVHLCKAHPEIFLLAAKKAHILPEESVFIDDLAKNVAMAKKVGVHAIHFRNFPQLKQDLKKLGVF